MPIYEYQCSACGHRQDVLQKISDPALTDCSICHKPTFSKAVSAAGFRLSGSGWYETDFKTGAKKNLASSDAAKASTADAGGAKAASAPSASSTAKTAP